MRLYRVETEDGEGPYRGLPSAYTWGLVPLKDGLHPTPHDEQDYLPDWRELTRRWGTPNIKYGFAFNDQLNRWFSGEWFQNLGRVPELSGGSAEYGVAEYTIDPRSVYVTPTQAVFNGAARSLKRIKWTPLSEMLREKGSETV